MIRFVTFLFLLICVSACTSSFAPLRSDQPGQQKEFETALNEFETGDPGLMKELAGNSSASPWDGYARTILDVCNKKDRTIRTLRNENRSFATLKKELTLHNEKLTRQNKILQENLDKLNQINLELEKREN